jgi:hypothetical protein
MIDPIAEDASTRDRLAQFWSRDYSVFFDVQTGDLRLTRRSRHGISFQARKRFGSQTMAHEVCSLWRQGDIMNSAAENDLKRTIKKILKKIETNLEPESAKIVEQELHTSVAQLHTVLAEHPPHAAKALVKAFREGWNDRLPL